MKRIIVERLIFESVNCDGEHILWKFNDKKELIDNFHSDDCILPSNDDEIISARIQILADYTNVLYQVDIPCETFEDLATAIGLFDK